MFGKWSLIAWCSIVACLVSVNRPAAADDLEEVIQLEQVYQSQIEAFRYDEAEKVAKQMLAICERAFKDAPEHIAIALRDLARLYNNLARYSEAEPLQRRALEIYKKLNGLENQQTAVILSDLGQTYRGLARYAEAEKHFLQTLGIQERVLGKNHTEVSTTLDHLSMLYDDQARYADAEPLYRRALWIKEVGFGRDDPNLAYTLNNFAISYYNQARYAEAEPLLLRARKIREIAYGPDHPLVGDVLQNLALVYERQSRYAEAERLCQRGLKIVEKSFPPEHTKVSNAISNLALVYHGQGRFTEAEPLYLRTLKIEEKIYGPDHPEIAVTLNNIACLYLDLDRLAEAEPLHQRALKIRESTYAANHPAIAQSLWNLASICNLQKRYPEAEKLYDRTIKICEQNGSDPIRYHSALYGRADIRWETDHRDLALNDLQQALKIAEQMRTNFSGGESEHAEAFQGYTRTFEQMVTWQVELKNLDAALQAAERSRARSLVDQINLQGLDLLAGLDAKVAQALRNRDVRAGAAILALEKQLEVLADRKDLSDTQKTTEQNRLNTALKTAREEQVEAYNAIRNASPAYRMMVGRDFKPIELSTLHHLVKDQQGLLLQYFLGHDEGYLIVVAADAEPQILKLAVTPEQAASLGCDAGPLTAQRLKAALELKGKPLAEVFKQPSAREGDLAAAIDERMAQLWKLLIPENFQKALVDGKYKRLIIVPDGGLVNLPFDALVVEKNAEGSKYLLDVGPSIMSCPSSTLLFNLATREGKDFSSGASVDDGKLVLSVGDPIYAMGATRPQSGSVTEDLTPRARYSNIRGALKPLPFSGWEAEWVAENFNPAGLSTSKLTKGQATEQAVRANLAGRQIVHLACHGLTDQNYGNLFGALAFTPGKAGSQVATDDGFLTLAEIYALNMQGCELAILSACETNLGPEQQGEGVFALSRGFLVAGARRVVASNWIVDDQSSASLVSAFCSKLANQHKAEQPMDYAQALHEAKRWVRKQEKWKQPYYWGAFVIVGPG